MALKGSKVALLGLILVLCTSLPADAGWRLRAICLPPLLLHAGGNSDICGGDSAGDTERPCPRLWRSAEHHQFIGRGVDCPRSTATGPPGAGRGLCHGLCADRPSGSRTG